MSDRIRVYITGSAVDAAQIRRAAERLHAAGYLVARPDFTLAPTVAEVLAQVDSDLAAVEAADVLAARPGEEWLAERMYANLIRRPIVTVDALLAAVEVAA